MTTILKEDFECWNTNGWGTSFSGTYTLTIPSATAKYKGNYGGLFACSTAGIDYVYITKAITASQNVRMKLMFKIPSASLSLSDGEGRVMWRLVIGIFPTLFGGVKQVAGKLYLYYGAITTTTEVTTDEWHELSVSIDSNGRYLIHYDNKSILNSDGTVGNYGRVDIGCGDTGSPTTGSATIYYDEILVQSFTTPPATIGCYEKPQKRVEINGDDVSDDVSSVQVTLRENALNDCTVFMCDYEGKTFVAKVDAGDEIEISFMFDDKAGDSFNSNIVFCGWADSVEPGFNAGGETVTVNGYCRGIALKRMRYAGEVGWQSRRPNVVKLNDILTRADAYGVLYWARHVMGDAGLSSGYQFNDNFIYEPSWDYPYFNFPYETLTATLEDLMNYGCINAFVSNCNLGNPPHWIVKQDACGLQPKLCVAPVGDHDVTCDGGWVSDEWATYALGGAPVEITQDMVLRRFKKTDFEANYVLISAAFQRPGSGDLWTEGHSDDWGTDTPASVSLGDGIFKAVGDMSLCATITNCTPPIVVTFYYPKSEMLGIDIDKICTPELIPTIGFYIMRNAGAYAEHAWGEPFILLGTGPFANNDYYYLCLYDYINAADSWNHVTLPIGPYYALHPTHIKWGEVGSPNWNKIDWIGFMFGCGDTPPDPKLYIDGLRINGVLLRAAYDNTHILNNHCKTKVIKDTYGKDDSLVEEDDSGAIGTLALKELLRSVKSPLTGTVVLPLTPSILPGQFIYLEGSRADAGEELDGYFRITTVTHDFSASKATTTIDVTDDLKNSYPIGPVDAYNIILEATNPTQYQNKTSGSLIGSDIDWSQTILKKNYDTSGW